MPESRRGVETRAWHGGFDGEFASLGRKQIPLATAALFLIVFFHRHCFQSPRLALVECNETRITIKNKSPRPLRASTMVDIYLDA